MKIILSPRPDVKSRIFIWLFFVTILYIYLRLFSDALIDDAFIVLSYVRTLSTSGTWGFFPGYIANSATSPLNVLLLAVVSLFTGLTADAMLWLTLICHIFIAVLLVQISNRLFGVEVFGWLGAFALIFNPLLVSTLGLESILFTALFILSLYSHITRRFDLLAVSLGLLTLTRAEGGLFLLVFLLFVPGIETKMRLLILYGLSIAPWYLFSWIHLGSVFPDTVFIKTDQGSWAQWDFFNGLSLYRGVYPLETLLSFIFLLPAIPALVNKNWRITILLIIALAGSAHFIGYSLLHVPPFHWYYVPQAVAVILLGSLGLGLGYKNASILWKRTIIGYITALYFVIPILGMIYILAKDKFSVREMPIHSNWATHEQYKEIGLWLNHEIGGESIRLKVGEIGTLAYYCDCYLLDRFSDRNWLEEQVRVNTAGGGLKGILYKANFMFFKAADFPPDAYILRAYPGTQDVEIELIKKWKTSTKWIPQGQIILYK